MEILLVGLFVIFVLGNVASYLANARNEKTELRQREKIELERRQEIIQSAAQLEAERQRLKGTGKVPFVDWESSFLESYTIRFRRPNPPRVKPTGWTAEWDKIQLLKQESCCFWCGTPLDGIAHRDHIQPLARGGINHVSNLVMACPPCNFDKSASEPKSWVRNTARISENRKLVLERILNLHELEDEPYDFVPNVNQGINSDNSVPEEIIEFELVQLSLFDDKS